MNQIVFITLVPLLSICACFAQDEVEEIETFLREAERNREGLQSQLEVVADRSKLLRELKQLHLKLKELEQSAETAENDEDEEKLEEIDDQIGNAEGRVEELYLQLELLEHKEGLQELMQELDDQQSDLLTQAKGLLDEVLKASAVASELFRVYREGSESKEAALEQRLEDFEEGFEIRREILQLRFELFHAEERDDEEDVRLLRRELEELEAEQGVTREPVESERPKIQLPSPIHVGEQDIATARSQSFTEDIVPLLEHNCMSCHNDETSGGELNIQQLMTVTPLVKNRQKWKNIIQQIKIRSMPPAEADQPTEQVRRTMAAWLTNAIDNFDYQTVSSPGFEPARRLTHEEYNNTIRDLTGLDLRPADKFPDDMAASSGFDNSANSLFIAPVTMERYMGAAEAVVDAAFPLEDSDDTANSGWERLSRTPLNDSSKAKVEQLVRQFASRAYRRPVSEDELNSLIRHYARIQPDGVFNRAAVRSVLKLVLVNPAFLLRLENIPSNSDQRQTFRISQWETASRLSYFLWASMPDEELYRAARSSKLNDPEQLLRQVDRMLADPKAETLGRIFAAQWLRYAELDRVQRDQIDNPWASDSLVAAMAEESSLLFNSLIRQNAPLERLLDADFTFVNEELARHYNMEGVRGDEHQRVSLADSPRRGLLGHASILALTSFPGRTSPVVRGNWILSELLGTPPPPPPPNVSDFDERVAENHRLTQRQKMELHRRNPNCYSCHSQIDPLGFALEEFEWFGRYRPERRGKKVDASGRLPSGAEFTGLVELVEQLKIERIDDLSEQFVRKLLSYALGRQLDYYDEATVRRLTVDFQKNERRIPALIRSIVTSDPFLMKQSIPIP